MASRLHQESCHERTRSDSRRTRRIDADSSATRRHRRRPPRRRHSANTPRLGGRRYAQTASARGWRSGARAEAEDEPEDDVTKKFRITGPGAADFLTAQGGVDFPETDTSKGMAQT